MDSETCKEVDIHGRTLYDVCIKMAYDIMKREALYVALRFLQGGEEDELSYLSGFSHGFAFAVEMVIKGKLDLQVIDIEKEIEP